MAVCPSGVGHGTVKSTHSRALAKLRISPELVDDGAPLGLLGFFESLDDEAAASLLLRAATEWLRSRGYDKAYCVLPHDGASHDKVYSVSYESALRQAGFEVKVIPNMGTGAATQRIETARRLFPNIRFNADTTQAGRDALGAYHEKHDDKRGIGLGPAHDWSSHGSDAFGLMCVDYYQTDQRTADLSALETYTVDY